MSVYRFTPESFQAGRLTEAIILDAVPATTRVIVSRRLGYPYLIDQLLLQFSTAGAGAGRFKLLVSDDNDTTDNETPSGDHVYRARSNVAADRPGYFNMPPGQAVLLEPRYVVTRPGTYLKGCWASAAGATVAAAHIIIIPL